MNQKRTTNDRKRSSTHDKRTRTRNASVQRSAKSPSMMTAPVKNIHNSSNKSEHNVASNKDLTQQQKVSVEKAQKSRGRVPARSRPSKSSKSVDRTSELTSESNPQSRRSVHEVSSRHSTASRHSMMVHLTAGADSNELDGLEAERPSGSLSMAMPAKVRVRGQLFNLLAEAEGSLLGDYGRLQVQEAINKRPHDLIYEITAANCKRVLNESRVMVLGVACAPHHRIPRMHAKKEDLPMGLTVVLTETLGPTVPQFVDLYYNRKPSTEFLLRVALQTLEAVEDIHRSSYLHRDIKPTSFRFGTDLKRPKIYLTNFGLARLYRDPSNLELIKPRNEIPFFGHLTFACRNAHDKNERTKMDDFESWLYTVIDLFSPKALPWKSVTDREEVGKMKKSFMKADEFKDTLEEKLAPKAYEFLVTVRREVEAPKDDYIAYKKFYDHIKQTLADLNTTEEFSGVDKKGD